MKRLTQALFRLLVAIVWVAIHQTLQAITLALPVEPALQNALIDVDGDSYLERTQWLAAQDGQGGALGLLVQDVVLGLQQLSHSDPQGIGDFFYIVQRDVANLPLHVSDEGAMKISLKRQNFLRPLPFLTKPHHVDCQHLARRAALACERSHGRGGWLDRTAGHRPRVFGLAAFEPAVFVSQYFRPTRRLMAAASRKCNV